MLVLDKCFPIGRPMNLRMPLTYCFLSQSPRGWMAWEQTGPVGGAKSKVSEGLLPSEAVGSVPGPCLWPMAMASCLLASPYRDPVSKWSHILSSELELQHMNRRGTQHASAFVQLSLTHIPQVIGKFKSLTILWGDFRPRAAVAPTDVGGDLGKAIKRRRLESCLHLQRSRDPSPPPVSQEKWTDILWIPLYH